MDHFFANLCSAIWWWACNAAPFSFRSCVFHVHDWPTPWCQVIFVSMILWCRVSQLACKHWQVWPPSMRSCAHPESDSDWCERCVKCYCTRFNCSYALMHLCPVYIGLTALKVHCDGKYQKGWKKKTSAAVLEFGRLSHYCHTHTHTKICRDYFQVWS